MTYTVQALDDGTAIFSWEFALGEYLAGRGMQVGSDEALNQFCSRARICAGRRTAPGSSSAIEQTEALLSSIRLDQPE